MSQELGRIEVVGVRQVVAELKDLDPALRRESVKAMRSAAAPLQAAVRALIPAAPPLSGMAREWNGSRIKGTRVSTRSSRSRPPALPTWNSAAARRGVTVRYGGRYSKSSSSWPLLRLQQKDPWGSIFDMAGRGDSRDVFVQRIQSRYGSPSRTMWKAAETQLTAVQLAVKEAANQAASQVNRKVSER